MEHFFEWYLCGKDPENSNLVKCFGPTNTALGYKKWDEYEYYTLKNPLKNPTLINVFKFNPFKHLFLLHHYNITFNPRRVRIIKEQIRPS